MGVLLLGGEIALPLLLYVVHAILLAVPFWGLLGLAGRHRLWLLLAFVPLVSRLLCVLVFGAIGWHSHSEESASLRRARFMYAVLSVLGFLVSLGALVWGLGEIFFVFSDASPALVDIARRDRFFLGVFAIGSGGSGLSLIYLWSLWRGALLVCERTGYDRRWAVYIFVPGFNLLLPWVLCSRWRRDLGVLGDFTEKQEVIVV